MKEFDELNHYARHGMQLIVTWYTFFIGANLFALGWFYTDGGQKAQAVTLLRYAICPIFIFVNVIGIFLCIAAANAFRKRHGRVLEIMEWVASLQKVEGIQMESPVPVDVYLKAIYLMLISLCGTSLAWAVFLVIMIIK